MSTVSYFHSTVYGPEGWFIIVMNICNSHYLLPFVVSIRKPDFIPQSPLSLPFFVTVEFSVIVLWHSLV